MRRHTVRLVPHDPAWADQFRNAAEEIGAATSIDRTRIEHVGSTAVRDLPAKPILDIDLGIVESEDIEEIVARLVRIGYIDRGDGEGGIGRLLVWESAPQIRTMHVHMVRYDSHWWRRDLSFRDALRSNPNLRERYARLKIELAQRFPSDRTSYRKAKGLFFREVLPTLGIPEVTAADDA